MDDLLPKESFSAEIGHRAHDAFLAQKPALWRVSDLSGDSDAGIDAFIQVVAQSRYSTAFNAQFKGSTESAYSADGGFVSVPLRVATINYYKRLGIPVMLVFADFSKGEKRSSCPIFYLWVHNKLDVALSRVKPGADLDSEVTFRVPTANRLHEDLDVNPFLAEERQHREKLQMLTTAIAGVPSAPPPAIAVEMLAANISSRGATFLESTLGSTDVPWADPEAGTTAWQLKQLHQRVTDGLVSEAQTLMDRINPSAFRDEIERAEFALLQARLLRLAGRADDASAKFAEAHNLAPRNPRYLAAWLENRVLASFRQNETVEPILSELGEIKPESDPQLKAIRARILIILHRYDKAEAQLDAIPPEHAAVERLVLLLAQRRLDQAIEVASKSKTLNVSRHALLTLRILGARAHFEKAYGVGPNDITPPTGPSELDTGSLSALWDEMNQLAQDLQGAGWPLNSEYIIDALTALAISTGRADEALLLVDRFSKARPVDSGIQLCRMKLAVFARKYEIAVEAARCLGDPSLRAIHLALIYYQAGQFRKSVDQVPGLVDLPFDKDPLLPEALAVAAHSAHRIFEVDAMQRCVNRLTEGGFSDQLSVFKMVSGSDAGIDGLLSARAELLDAYRNSPGSEILQDHAVIAFRLEVQTEAAELIELCRMIGKRRRLAVRESVILAKAMGTLNRRSEAIDLLSKARVQYPQDETLKASQALLAESFGQTALARQLLSGLLTSPKHGDFARSLYINIAARSGLLEEAFQQFQSLLAEATTPDKKKDALKGLISLDLFRETPSSSLNLFVREFGRLADKNAEEEEGLFIQMTMLAGLRTSYEPTEPEVSEIRARITSFTERFPTSDYFGTIPIGTNAGIQELEQALKNKFGALFEENEDLAKLRMSAKRGQAVVPFAWRPKVLVPAARTIPQLWELTKRAGNQNGLLSFDMDQVARPLADLRKEKRIPLFDLVSLLVITDLKLWPILLRVFDRIAIPKETLLRIQNDGGPASTPSPSLAQLRSEIRQHLDNIEQPGDVSDSDIERRDAGLDDAKKILIGDRFIFYSDDVAARVYVLGDTAESDSIHTGRFMRAAEQLGFLTALEVGRKLAQLVRWHIGFVTFDDRHLLVCMPPGLASAPSLGGKIQALFMAADYQALISGVWDPPKPFQDTLRHIARLLVFVLRFNPEIDDRVVAAIWASWLDKVSLRAETTGSIEEQLATVLVLACWSLRDSENASRTLWNSYVLLVERYYGDRMDENREREARYRVGQIIASLISGSEGEFAHRADEMLAAVRKGLTRDTAPDEHFIDAYTEARALYAKKLKEGGHLPTQH